MRRREVLIVPGAAELARAAAERVCSAAREAIAARGAFNLCLSGGSTPRALYRELARDAGRAAWRRWRFFFGDERCVPPEHPDSNYRTARESLFAPLRIPERQIFRMQAERADLEQAAQDYEKILLSNLADPLSGTIPCARNRTDGTDATDLTIGADAVAELNAPGRKNDRGEMVDPAEPVFDLILLGMGDDGHTASLFPGAESLNNLTDWVIAAKAPALGVRRMTITFRTIDAARERMMLVCGAGKAARLKEVFAQLDSRLPRGQRLPIACIDPARGDTLWLLDNAAAAQLDR